MSSTPTSPVPSTPGAGPSRADEPFDPDAVPIRPAATVMVVEDDPTGGATDVADIEDRAAEADHAALVADDFIDRHHPVHRLPIAFNGRPSLFRRGTVFNSHLRQLLQLFCWLELKPERYTFSVHAKNSEGVTDDNPFDKRTRSQILKITGNVCLAQKLGLHLG